MKLNKRKYSIKMSLFILIICFSCEEEKKLNANLDSLNKDNIIREFGEIKDSLEVGRWLYRKDKKTVKEGRYQKGYKIGPWNYYENGEKSTINWNVYLDKNIKINYPNGWNVEDNLGYLFYALPDKNSKDFFLCIEHKKSEVKLSLYEYLEKVLIEIKNNKERKILNYSLQKIEYSKRIAYYLILKTKHNHIVNTYLAFYTENKDFIYDFTLNFKRNSNEDYYKIFGGMVYSFSKKTEKLFYSYDKILNINEISID